MHISERSKNVLGTAKPSKYLIFVLPQSIYRDNGPNQQQTQQKYKYQKTLLCNEQTWKKHVIYG